MGSTQERRRSTDVIIASLAAKRLGIISRSDLVAAGVSAQAIYRRMRSGRLIEILPGVYTLPGPDLSWRQKLMAALVWAGPEARASHRAAAALLELDGFSPDVIELTTSVPRKSPNWLILHRARRVWGYDLMFKDPFTLTTPARTLLDLGAVADVERVELALEDALRRRLTTVSALQWELRKQGGRGTRGTRVLRKLLSTRPVGHVATDSGLEVRVDRLLRSLRRLPEYKRQVPINTRLGRVRVDFGFVDWLMAVEADSYRWHSGHDAWSNDKQRDRAIKAEGWDVMYVSNDDLRFRRNQVIRDLYESLRRRGWDPAC